MDFEHSRHILFLFDYNILLLTLNFVLRGKTASSQKKKKNTVIKTKSHFIRVK